MLVLDSDEKTLFTRALRIFSVPRRAPIASSNEITKKKQGKPFFTSLSLQYDHPLCSNYFFMYILLGILKNESNLIRHAAY